MVYECDRWLDRETLGALATACSNSVRCMLKLVLCVLGTCSSYCDSNGCWGPGDKECLQCSGYRLEGRCVDYCDLANGYYANATTKECWPCHPECLNSCTGPVSLTLHMIMIHACHARFSHSSKTDLCRVITRKWLRKCFRVCVTLDTLWYRTEVSSCVKEKHECKYVICSLFYFAHCCSDIAWQSGWNMCK